MRHALLVRPVALRETCDPVVLARAGICVVGDRGGGNGREYCEG